jgi:ribulose-phosphate 3-epimerase
VNLQIAPSILSADVAALGQAVATLERGGADLIHVDVMHGHFVPNITIGVPDVRALKRVARVPLDVHLMIADPDRYIDAFAAAGAAMISVHVEVLPHLHRTVHAIRALGVKAGVVLNPSTPVASIENVAADVDFVLIMSVNPGFGGQTFSPRSTSKVEEVRTLLDRAGNRAAPIEVDGGIDARTAPLVVAAGARILVAGSALFQTDDPERATRELRTAAAAGLPSTPPVGR